MTSRSIPIEDRFWTKVSKGDECWHWQAYRDERGYGIVNFKGRPRRAHRVAYILTHGDIPSGLVVRHSCDNPACVNPEHLLIGTQLDNIRDRNERGRTAKGENAGATKHPERYGRKGERNGNAKLTRVQALAIRDEYATGEIGTRPLAEKYGVSRSMVRFIIQGKNWIN